MSIEEVKNQVDKIAVAFEEFKKTNDKNIEEKAKKGVDDVVNELKLDRINKEITDLTELKSKLEKAEETAKRVSELEVALDRKMSGKSHDEKAVSEAEQAHKSAYANYILTGRGEAELQDSEQKMLEGLDEMERKALSAGSNPDGGYLVTPDMASNIITSVYETSPMRQICNVQTIASDSYEILTDRDEAGAEWVGETGARNETDTPELGKRFIYAHELAAKPKATQKMIDDASLNIEQWLAGKIADKFSRMENTAFVTGNGIAKPKGITAQDTVANASHTETSNALGYVATGAAGDFAASNKGDALISLVYALKAAYRPNAKWLMASALIEEVRKFKDSDGNYLWQRALAAGQPETLLSYEVVQGEDMPTKAANSLSIAFGDFRGYTIVDRTGIRTLRDPYSEKPYVQFYTTKRVGGDIENFEAIKLLKFAAS